MKRKLLLGLGLLLSIGAAKAQFTPYNYTVNVDLDTTAITYSYSSTQGATSYKDSPSTDQFFPHPGGLYNIRALFSASATTNAQFSLANSVLTMKNATNGAIKVGVDKVINASPVSKVSFDIDLATYTGNGAIAVGFGSVPLTGGNNFNNVNAISGANNQLFGSFRLVKSGSNVVFQYRAADLTNTNITGTQPFVTGNKYKVEVYLNNSSSATAIKYNHGTTTGIDLAQSTYHVYVNGNKLNMDFPRSTNDGLTIGSNLNALMFVYSNNATQENLKIENLSITYKTETNLPVSLTSFTGKLNNNFVDLKWATVSEQNNSHFEVLRSSDSKSFSVLDRVAGNGTTSEPKEYNYTDRSPLAGTNYYQLKQYDLDGKENAIDKIVAIKTALGNSEFTVFVNKENQLTASVFSENQTTAKIGVYDVSGKQVFQEDIRLEKGNNAFAKHLPFLQSGVYVLKLAANGNTQSIKFIK